MHQWSNDTFYGIGYEVIIRKTAAFRYEYLVLLRTLQSSSYDMMTSSNGNIFRVTGPLWGEFTGPGEFPTQRPVTRSFGVFFDLRLNKRLSKKTVRLVIRDTMVVIMTSMLKGDNFARKIIH